MNCIASIFWKLSDGAELWREDFPLQDLAGRVLCYTDYDVDGNEVKVNMVNKGAGNFCYVHLKTRYAGKMQTLPDGSNEIRGTFSERFINGEFLLRWRPA